MIGLPRKPCPECRYPMLELKYFDGISSRDAPGFEYESTEHYRWLGLWAIVYDVGAAIWRSLGTASRKKKVQQLKDQHLAQFPNTIICPRCMLTIERA